MIDCSFTMATTMRGARLEEICLFIISCCPLLALFLAIL